MLPSITTKFLVPLVLTPVTRLTKQQVFAISDLPGSMMRLRFRERTNSRTYRKHPWNDVMNLGNVLHLTQCVQKPVRLIPKHSPISIKREPNPVISTSRLKENKQKKEIQHPKGSANKKRMSPDEKICSLHIFSYIMPFDSKNKQIALQYEYRKRKKFVYVPAAMPACRIHFLY